jgi:hypothetical protein
MNLKFFLAVLSIAGILSMGIVNCSGGGDLTVLKSGTYDCTDEEKEKFTFIFDTSKNIWDYIKDGNKLSDALKSLDGVLILGKRDKNTKSYKLSRKSKNGVTDIGVLNITGTKFSIYSKEGAKTKINICIKR